MIPVTDSAVFNLFFSIQMYCGLSVLVITSCIMIIRRSMS
jgi:hypothetical protein